MSLYVLATGGTIASLVDPDTGAVRPAVSGAELVRSVAGLEQFDPRVEEIAHVNGWNVIPAVMLEVARRAQAAADDPSVEGVVVTHGTDTMEETAFLCDLLVRSDKPVVFAAAMRSGGELSADGPRNLLNAARVATDASARGLGTVVVMNDEVHAARWARKQDSFRTGAFASPGQGPVGLVLGDGVRVLRRPAAPPELALPDRLDAEPVAVVQTYTGMEETLIAAVLEATGAAGLVLEGTGLGNVPGAAEAGIRHARACGLPVVVATRVPTGGTGAVYGGPGGGVTLRELGVLAAGTLTAAKARLLLMALLASGDDDALAARFMAFVEALP